MAIDLGAGLVPLPPLHWDVDPTQFALTQARRRRDSDAHPTSDTTNEPAFPPPLPTSVCTEVGRRLLLAQLTWSSWVLRRVEKASFISDRRLLRASSVELRVPDFAPTVRGSDGEQHWLVPLSLMRRRTLVNLDLADEDGSSLSLLGLRFTQQLDQSMLWAAAGGPDVLPDLPRPLDDLISSAVAGTAADVRESYLALATMLHRAGRSPGSDRELLEATLDRLWHNFTLYVLLPVSRGRHRRLRVAFEERIRWKHQRPVLEPDSDHAMHYVPMRKDVASWRTTFQSLAARPTRIRFLVPSAETCASYHFEFRAPTGMAVDGADLLAGRPNQPEGEEPRVSTDSVSDPGHSVGLHAVEVPAGSLCRAQVDLRIPRRGWLSTVLLSMMATTAVMVAVVLFAQSSETQQEWDSDRATNVIVLLVSVAAATATYVAQQHATDIMNRLARGLRGVAAVAMAVPAVAAAIITLRWKPDNDSAPPVRWLTGLTVVATASLLIVLVVFGALWLRERRSPQRRASPWDMTHVSLAGDPRCGDHAPGGRKEGEHLDLADRSFRECARVLGFDRAAVGVYSAEGWLEHYRWSDAAQEAAVRKLHEFGHDPEGCPAPRHVRVDRTASTPRPGAR